MTTQEQVCLLVRRRDGRGGGRAEGPPRRQGGEPGRDGPAGPPGPPRLHDHDGGLHLVLRPREGLPEGAGRRGRRAPRPASRSSSAGSSATPNNPLLVSVRSGARASMPGMMDTILNLGLNDGTVEGLAKGSKNPRFAWDCYRRFVAMYGDVVLGLKPVDKHERDPFEVILEKKKHARGVKLDTELPVDALKELVREFKAEIRKRTGQSFPDDPMEQLWGAIGAVFGSWMNERAIVYRQLNGIPRDWGTAVNVQSMVFGNLGDDCGTGVAFTRDPATGENVFYGEYLINAQGEDVVAGIRTPQKIATLEGADAGHLRAAPRHPEDAREPLPRHAGHRVHGRARQALHAPDPHRQADRLRRGADRRRDGATRS